MELFSVATTAAFNTGELVDTVEVDDVVGAIAEAAHWPINMDITMRRRNGSMSSTNSTGVSVGFRKSSRITEKL